MKIVELSIRSMHGFIFIPHLIVNVMGPVVLRSCHSDLPVLMDCNLEFCELAKILSSPKLKFVIYHSNGNEKNKPSFFQTQPRVSCGWTFVDSSLLTHKSEGQEKTPYGKTGPEDEP